MANIERVIGETCHECGKGKYVLNPKTQKTFCEKKCWLNKTEAMDYETVKEKKIEEAVERKNENINWSNAKNNATLLVANLNMFRMMTEEQEVKDKLMELANWFYHSEPTPFE